MLINFDEIPEDQQEKVRGGEGINNVRAAGDALAKINKCRLEPGAYIGYHQHETNSEIIFILEGTGKVRYDDGVEPLGPGSCHYCPKGHYHSLINDSDKDLIFYAVIPDHCSGC